MHNMHNIITKNHVSQSRKKINNYSYDNDSKVRTKYEPLFFENGGSYFFYKFESAAWFFKKSEMLLPNLGPQHEVILLFFGEKNGYIF